MSAHRKDLYRTDEFEDWLKESEFKNNNELFYALLVAWSRGFDDGFKKGMKAKQDEIYDHFFARKEMGG